MADRQIEELGKIDISPYESIAIGKFNPIGTEPISQTERVSPSLTALAFSSFLLLLSSS